MKVKVSVLFYIRKSKTKSSSHAPIYMRITVNGTRAEFSTGKNVEISKWNRSTTRIRGNSEEARVINNHLDILKSTVLEIENKFVINGEPFDAEDIKNNLLGNNNDGRYLIPVFEDHNTRMQKLIGKEYAIATLKNFRTCLKHLKSFLWKTYKKSDINLIKLEPSFLNDFDFYLRTQANINNNAAVKHSKNLAKILKSCYRNGWIEKDLVQYYSGKYNEVTVNYLTEDEIELIRNKEFSGDGLNLVKDIFLFSCYTGLAYIDIYNLTSKQISVGIDGNLWVITNRQKTGTSSNVPLLPFAKSIIEKYRNHPFTRNSGKLLPVYTNQKVNEYLKTIADNCGISKKLTFHCARHTFATSVTLSNNVSIESVSKMLGHKNIKTTQHYAKILDKKVSEDMGNLTAILQQKQELQKMKMKKLGS
ncbi:site-specific integrase [Chryseobacterium taklimakanense]|uniref:Site-specific integrase n=1 Tax=Chryseobacterium taklimakanense TaxID=536441 RepID=A0A3G8WHK2_9FLAO|nr:site-specific integrase [Chryseobacterium taklimakanense]AZI20655.1 site-specific integrase [Chryseobacterium taklimakanense]